MNMSMSHHLSGLTRVGDHHRRELKKPRQFFKWMLGSDPQPSDAQVEELKRYLLMGDRLADAVVAMYRDLPTGQGRKLLDQALEQGIDSLEEPPQALVDLFAQIDEEPIWLDRDKIKLGCDVSRRVGVSGELVLRNLSLMAGYLGSAAAKPLVFTGQLDRMTPRRLVETGKFWFDVTTPGGLERNGEGFKSAIRVRMMHAQVRNMLLNSNKWKMEWGHPLNQADTMATTLEFSIIFMLGLRAIGFIINRREREAVIHLWRYIGYLMGVEERILPADEADALRALYLMTATAGGPDEDSRALGVSLANVPLQEAGDKWYSQALAKAEYHLRVGYTRYILGDKAADILGLPANKMKYFWMAQFPLRFGSELVRATVQPVNRFVLKLNNKLAEKQFPERVSKTQADTSFTPVNQLAR
ncbi:MAG TPA: oxygenase MpaB family protein [Pseudomonadales bacterium]|nr:oxygenase MpaB family protein [Pseudomonadales bacterium]